MRADAVPVKGDAGLTIYTYVMRNIIFSSLLLLACCCTFFYACKNKKPPEREIVTIPEQMDEKAAEIVQNILKYAGNTNGKVDDSITLRATPVVKFLYQENKIKTAWCSQEQWMAAGDSLFSFIENAKLYGLFPDDYHYRHLTAMRNRIINDAAGSGDRKDAAIWARGDVMLTDAFVNIIKDIKLGRLPKDSITLRKDSVLSNEFYRHQFDTLLKTASVSAVMQLLEPVHPGYHQLKAGIKTFLSQADFKDHSRIQYPNKNTEQLKKELSLRLYEEGFLTDTSFATDSLQLAVALKNYQEQKGLTADGKVGAQTAASLNDSDRERFIRIAITLDKYKLLPSQMPEKYLWVNLPGYYMQLRERDSAKIYSRVVVGKPYTRTPLLNSAISEMITYPQWTIPSSIIEKEILPAAKRDPGYFARRGYSLLNSKNEEVDPYLVDWSLYKKGIPYRVIQGSGDANALGILKFNFSNKYSVYLHDTNQRYLFSRAARALSHGCVRVQEWEKLTYYILRNDSINGGRRNMADSVKRWLSKKEKHSIAVKNRIPLFIRYFTCEGRDNNIVFYDDIYGEDKRLRERYFANK